MLIKSSFKYMLMAGLFTLSVTGCMKKEFFDSTQQEPEQEPEKDNGKVTLDDYFDFSTTQEVRLNVDYGSGCPKAYFEVYAENPLIYQEEGAQVTKRKDIIHIAGGFTDGDGKYDKLVTIPASVTEVYIYSPDFGVPTLYRTEVTDKAVNATISFDNELDISTSTDGARAVESRIATADQIWKYIPYRLGGWKTTVTPYGEPDYLVDGLKINISAELKKYITTFFPEGGNNSNSPYISHDTDVLIKEQARVWVNYFGGNTAARSVFAYYCYEEGATTEEIKKAAAERACVIFPKAHREALGDYSGVGTYLRYIDSKGNMSAVDDGFPPGTKIGFLLWNEGFYNPNKDFSSNTFYSTESLNSKNRSQTAIFAANASDGKKYNIITFEDWTDSDYNDVAFIISSDPIKALEIPDAPDPEDDRTATTTYRGVLGFEDNWPRQGDYDLNDVVIKYVSDVTYNVDNAITKIVDNITLAWTGASYSNGFSYQVPFSLDLVTVEGAASTSTDNVINVFSDARKELGVSGMAPADMPSHATEIQPKTFTITMTFKEPYAFGVTPPYNPFIRLGNTEVHLPNRAPTANANNAFPQEADISDGKTTFFICEDGYPFALHMDARADESIMNLDLTPEAVRIDVTYPGFSDWVKTRNPQTQWW